MLFECDNAGPRGEENNNEKDYLLWQSLSYRQIDDSGAIPTISATLRKEKLNSSFSAISSLILSSSPACLLLSLCSASLASLALLSDGVSSPSARNSCRDNSQSESVQSRGSASPGVCRASRSICCRCCSRPGACEYPSRSDWCWKYQPAISSPHPTCLMPAALGFALETVLVESFSVRSKDLLQRINGLFTGGAHWGSSPLLGHLEILWGGKC